jgi:tRNA (guanine-N7-)-methyltransferase
MQGAWKEHFKNNNPITLELACGKGEYALGLAQLHPDQNFVGVDLKGNRLWVGAKKATAQGLHNVAFLRILIDRITEYFGPAEVSEIWITFPDPQLRASKAKKRLTHPRFLRLYQKIMGRGGVVNLKTDSPALYHFTKQVINLFELELIQDFDNINDATEISDDLKIKTYYESLDIAQSNRIHYLKFSLNKPLPHDADEHLKQLLIEEAID